MSTKAATQQPRRAPLSLSGGGKQHSQNQYSGKSTDSNGSSNNSASSKNDKISASQKTEPTPNDATESSTTKEVKKSQITEKKLQSVNHETVRKNEKADEKKSQNGAGKATTNGGAKEKQQNGSDKQENGSSNASNTKSGNTNSNGNATAKSTIKSNEKTTAPAVKEDAKGKEQKSAQSNEKNEKDSDKEKEKEKKKENGPEKIVEKETRSRRHDSAAAGVEKKQTEKTESTKSDDTKSEVATPISRASAAQSKVSTPTRGGDKSSGASTPTKAVEKSSVSSQRTKTVTTVVDDVEMQPLVLESSPVKAQEHLAPTVAVVTPATVQPPAATSTPGKALAVTQKVKLQELPTNIQSTGSSPDRSGVPRTFTQIGGRRSIRPLNEYTPSKFQSNLQFRESYRRINTELDVSSTTNTSMNVTVGSEVPNSSSFSFFGRGRKRDRTPPQHSQSTMELQTDADYSPPKRARLDMFSIFNVVSSPLTMLRSRFSKASIQSSTPMRLTTKLVADDDEAEVQNVSGISIEEEINEGAESEEKTATEDVTVGKTAGDDTTSKMDSPMKVDEKFDEKNPKEDVESKSSDVHEIAAGIADTSVTYAKNKRCNIM